MDNSNEVSSEKVHEETVNVAQVQFFQLNKLIGKFSDRKDLSRKGCLRSIKAALNFGITDIKVNLRSDAEHQLAQILAEMLGPRTIMQAEIYKRLDEKEIDNGKE